MLRAEMIGCIGQDAVSKEIGGSMYACFEVAHSQKVNGIDKTTWVSVRKYDKDGKLSQYLTKGKPIFVEGRPQTNAYVNRDGVPVATLTIWADRVEFIAGAGQKPAVVPQPIQTAHVQALPEAVAASGNAQYVQPSPQYTEPQSEFLPY